jgi:hypothetical protein
MSQPPIPAAAIVTILPHHLEAVCAASVPSHPFGDFKDKPAQRREADAPEKHERYHPAFPLCFYRTLAPLAFRWQVTNC